MNRLLSLLSIILLHAPCLCLALPSDAQQPIKITSSEAQYNQRDFLLVYKGNVVATQGTTKLTAERVEVHFNHDNQIDKLQAFGHPAVYSTITNPERERLFASANTVEFYPLKSTVQLVENGHVSQGGNIMDSPHIVIDIAKETVVSKPSANGKTTIVLQPQQRVKPNDKASDKLRRSERSDHNPTQTTSSTPGLPKS